MKRLMPITELTLALCKSNDPRAQADLYDLNKAKVMGLCRRYTRSKEEAEDVFQETFIRVFQNIKQVSDCAHVEAWLRRVAINTSINHYHKHKRHHHDPELYLLDHPSDDYEMILSHLNDEMLLGLVNELPDGYRMVFNLHEIEGYSHQEIAEMLSISEPTSRSQLNRAKQTLKNKLKAFGIIRYEKYA